MERLEDRSLLAAVNWTGLGGNSSWTNGLNWSSTPNPPTSLDDVTIGAAGSPTVVIAAAQFISVRSVVVDAGAGLSLTGGSLSVSANSTINGALSANQALLQASTAGVVFAANGTTTISNVQLTANSGATFDLPNLTSYTSSLGVVLTQAIGSGSRINLENLTTITSTGGGSFRFEATGGGVIDISALASTSAPITFKANGANSNIDLTSLTTAPGSSFAWESSGTITTPALTAASGALTISGSTASLPSLANINESLISVSGGSQLSLPLVTSYTASVALPSDRFRVLGADSELSLNNLTNINASTSTSFFAGTGGVINVTRLTSTSGNVAFSSDGTDSTINLPLLTSMTGAGGNGLSSASGGTIQLPSLTTFQNGTIVVNGGSPSLPNLSNINGANVSVIGGASVSLPLVTSYANTTAAETTISASRSATNIDHSSLILGGLTTITGSSRVMFAGDTFGQVDLPVLASASNNTKFSGVGVRIPALTSLVGIGTEINGINGNVQAPKLARFNHGKLINSGNFPALTNIDGLSIKLTGGHLELPGVTSYVNTSGSGPTLEVTDAALSFPNLTLFDARTPLTSVNATSILGTGTIEFGALTDILGTAIFTARGFQPLFSDPRPSFIKFSALKSLTNSQVQFIETTSGDIQFPNLTKLQNVFIQQDANATFTVPSSLTYAVTATTAVGPTTGSVVNEGTISAQDSATFVARNLALNGSGTISVGPAATLDLRGHLTGNTTNSDAFHAIGKLQLFGSLPQQLEAMSEDRGPFSAGFENNFAYGTIDQINAASLIDQSDNSPGAAPEAIYVNQLWVRSGKTLNLNGLHVYARVAKIEGTVIGGTVMIVPGGEIESAVPAAGTISDSGEVDSFTFEGVAGKAVTIKLIPGGSEFPQPLSPNLSLGKVSLIDPDGIEVTTAQSATFGAAATLPAVNLLKTGRYTVRVQASTNQPTVTGNYVLTYFQVVINSRSLTFNQQYSGTLVNSQSLDQWTFSAAAGQQINLHTLGSFGGTVKYSLTGPGGVSVFSNLTADSGPRNLPATGNYVLSVQSNSDLPTNYAFRLDESLVVDVPLGSTQAGTIAGNGFAQLFKVTVPANQSLLATLTDGALTDVNELYVRYGTPPTRGEYDASATLANSPSQELVFPSAAPGTWYFLVYAHANLAPSSFSFKVVGQQIILSDVTPDRSAAGSMANVVLSGSGFNAPTTVQLVAADNTTTYAATAVSLDMYTQVTATFDLTSVPQGLYKVRVTNSNGQSELPGAFTVTAPGQARLETELLLPGVSLHIAATFYVKYANTGNVAMPAPVLVLQSSQPADLPLLTLDASVQTSGFWTSATPEGYANTVQILASGEIPGVLGPGESIIVPVYYAGMQQPWDVSNNTFSFQLRVLDRDDTTPVDWPSFQDDTRPPTVSAEAWSVIYAGLVQRLGTTLGGYTQLLDEQAAYLGKLGQHVTDVGRLWRSAIVQQIGITPLSVLADATDLEAPSAGLALDFSRQFATPLTSRFKLGPLGYGWTHNWQESLAVTNDGPGGGPGTVTVTMPSGAQRIFQPDSRTAGKYFAQIGDHGLLTKNIDTGAYTLTEANGLVEFFNANGTLGHIEDLNGNRITANYSGTQLTSLVSSSGNSLTFGYTGPLLSLVVGSDGRSASYDYLNSQLIAVHNFDGTTTRYTYDSSGDPIKARTLTEIQFRDGTHQFYTYDSSGRLSGTSQDGAAYPVTFSYDLGKATARDAENNASQFFYNDSGLLVKTVDPLGHAAFSAFDRNFNVTSVTDAAGLAARFSYDQQGNLLSATNPLGQTSRFTYTGAANLLASSTDALGQTTKYAYDEEANLTSIFYADQTARGATYDALGNPLTLINQNGQVISNTFDAFGQLTGETLADGTEYSFTYDTHGNLRTATSAAGPITLSYDTGDRLTGVSYPGGKSLTYTYDAGGRRERMTDHDGNATKYAYNATGQLAGLTDQNNAPIVTYTYNTLGQLEKSENGVVGSGPYTTYEYDATGNVLHLINFAGNSAINSRFDYAYTVLDQVATLTTIDGTWTYTYDTAGQLVHAVFDSTNGAITNQDLTYVYNAAGNRTQTIINGATSTYVSNNVNEYTSVTSPGGTTNYTYDLAGNMLSKTVGSVTTNYTYDPLSRLTGVNSPGESFAYQYDALGNLAATTHDGQTTTNLIDPTGWGNLVGQYTTGGSPIARYTHGLGLVSQVAGGSTNYYQFGTAGSTAALTDAVGTVLNSYSYRPFGELLHSTGSAANPFTFVGQFGVSGEGNGLFNMRARDYDPLTGQFLTNDPIGLQGGDLNLRRYVSNNPAASIDPLGTEYLPYIQAMIDANNAATAKQNQEQHGQPIGFDIADAGLRYNDQLKEQGSEQVKRQVKAANEQAERDRKQNKRDRRIEHAKKERDSLGVAEGIYRSPWGGSVSFYVDLINLTGLGRNGGGGSGKFAKSRDPNALNGPAGFGTPNYVASDATLPYEIEFENDADATAPAQRVTISNVLSTNLDPATFELTTIGFGDTQLTVPAGSQHFETTVSMTFNSQTFDVQITAGINLATHTVFAIFQSIDPATDLPPDVLTGFLPPEDGTGRGQGHVNYLIQAKSGLATGTEIRNVATIVFDVNDPIRTDQVDPHDPGSDPDPDKQALVTIDADAPYSSVSALPALRPASFLVAWTGGDGTGSGVASIDVYVSDNGEYALWKHATGSGSDTYVGGLDGHTYRFYSVATDNVGKTESAPGTADTSTKVDAAAPTSSVSSLSAFSPASFLVSWTANDGTGSGLAGIDVYVSDNGEYELWKHATGSGSDTYVGGVDGHTYRFYSVATDNVGNAESAPGTADTSTKVDAAAPTSSVSSLSAFSPASFLVAWSGSDGAGSGLASIDVYVSVDNSGSYSVWKNATGSGSDTYSGTNGHTYRFYSIATDNRGNAEAAPGSADTSTTVDTAAPTSSVSALPAFSPASFLVAWSGSDGAGSGLASIDVYVSVDNSGSYSLWKPATGPGSDSYVGTDGHTYRFYSIATDNRGNAEAVPGSADTSTTVDTAAPTSSVSALPAFSPASFLVAWSGSDGAGSGLASIDVYVSVDNSGSYSVWKNATGSGSDTYSGTNGHTYRFYSIATDNRGNAEAAPGSADTSTTVASQAYDFGDAPDSYHTLLGSNGPRHKLGSSLWLGSGVSGDSDGLPGPAADRDSDDGVVLPAALIAHLKAQATVTVSSVGRLDAWIDFDHSGSFEPGESIATSLIVLPGIPNRVLFAVPDSASPGDTYARFRLSTSGGLAPDDEVADGEVEDYAISIVKLAAGTTSLVADPLNPAGNLLVMVGTSGSDNLLVETRSGLIQAKRGGRNDGLPRMPSAVQRVAMIGLAGNDKLQVKINVPVEFWGDEGADALTAAGGRDYLDGGVGNDNLKGGAGNDLLRGGSGNDSLRGEAGNDLLIGDSGDDQLFGGSQRDILIGGTGKDNLRGESDDDLLIADTTFYDALDASLYLLRDEWSNLARDYPTRVDNLRSSNGPVLQNRDVKLIKGATVFDELSSKDTLNGGSNRDWYFLLLGSGNDKVEDKKADEFTN